MVGAGVIGFTTRSVPVGVETTTGPPDRQFVAECTWSHRAADDPIVHPGHPGAAHMHDFFGSEATDASSTAESLLGIGEHVPDAHRGHRRVLGADAVRGRRSGGTGSAVRLLPPAQVSPRPGASAAPYPLGLVMVAGDAVGDGRPNRPRSSGGIAARHPRCRRRHRSARATRPSPCERRSPRVGTVDTWTARTIVPTSSTRRDAAARSAIR